MTNFPFCVVLKMHLSNLAHILQFVENLKQILNYKNSLNCAEILLVTKNETPNVTIYVILHLLLPCISYIRPLRK